MPGNERFPVNWGGFSGHAGREGMLPQVYMKIDVESSTIDCLESLVASQSEGTLEGKQFFLLDLNSIFQPLLFCFRCYLYFQGVKLLELQLLAGMVNEGMLRNHQETYSSMCFF